MGKDSFTIDLPGASRGAVSTGPVCCRQLLGSWSSVFVFEGLGVGTRLSLGVWTVGLVAGEQFGSDLGLSLSFPFWKMEYQYSPCWMIKPKTGSGKAWHDVSPP